MGLKIYANDTFCLYIGWFLVAFGSLLLMSIGLWKDTTVVGFAGLGAIMLGISTQLMAFQKNPKDK